jgi:cupin fold WbuC family metalloprotein
VANDVFFPVQNPVSVATEDIRALKKNVKKSKRHRSRFCAHKDTEETLHEMFIVREINAYVRPHRDLKNSRSIHVIEGRLSVVIFDDVGEIVEVFEMGDYASNKVFYQRVSGSQYCTTIINSEVAVFHETTDGPFDVFDVAYAPWAPDENDHELVKKYEESLKSQVSRFLISQKSNQ